jgi:NAD(P)-dependent dehydrogenase (short-subunit alcohol dehydrogenase family)
MWHVVELEGVQAMQFSGHVVIVTGAASARGIGFATALAFASEGALVAVVDIDEQGAAHAAARLGEGHLGLGCDISNPVACAKAVARVMSRFGRIDILVNNAGIVSSDRLHALTHEHARHAMDVNAGGTIAMTLAARANLIETRGTIVNVASVAAQRGGGVFGGAHYAASKAAILGFTKACARELAPLGVRVNAVSPSMVDTDIFGSALGEDQRTAVLATIPLGRLARADEVANAILFLASDRASYITGATLDVNGGSHMH